MLKLNHHLNLLKRDISNILAKVRVVATYSAYLLTAEKWIILDEWFETFLLTLTSRLFL